MGVNHFCRMLCVCVWLQSQEFKVPLISLFNMGMCFLRCVFSIQMQYNIQSAIYIWISISIYTSRNCLHVLIRPWFRDCCSSPLFVFFIFDFSVYLCQCHESSCHLLMFSPFSPNCCVLSYIGKCVLWCTQFEKVGFRKRCR